MEFKVGDKAKVRNDPQVREHPAFASRMERFMGKIVTIAETHTYGWWYRIEEDGMSYYWKSEMFVPKEDKYAMKTGDVVKSKASPDNVGIVSFVDENDEAYVDWLNTGSTSGRFKRGSLESIDTNGDMTIEVRGKTIAVKRGEEVGMARCAPKDDYNLLYGIALAISRLAKPWPNVGDGFYSMCIVDSRVSVYRKDWLGDTSDKNCKDFGNCYKNREEAEAVAEEIRAVFAKYKQMAVK